MRQRTYGLRWIAACSCLLSILMLFCGTTPALGVSEPATPAALTHAAAKVSSTCTVIGPDQSIWATKTLDMEEGSTAAQLTQQVLDDAHLTYDASNGQWGFSLNTITDPDGKVYGYDAASGAYWQLFVNGRSSDVGASGVVLAPGDRITWSYSSWGTPLPAPPITLVPNAPHPSVEASWPAFRGPAQNLATSGGLTPVNPEATKALWTQQIRPAADWATYVSEPILVDQRLWLAKGTKLECRDEATGTIVKTIDLAGSIDSTCRLTYSQGLVLVPLSQGRIQAVSVASGDTLWVSEALPQIAGVQQQSLSSLTVHDSALWFGTCAPDPSSNQTFGGYLVALNLENGTFLPGFPRLNSQAGYYWGGGTLVSGLYVIGADDGSIEAFDPASGGLRFSARVEGSVRSSLVPCAGGFLAVTTNGVIHKFACDESGLTQVAQQRFADASTSTPTAVDGKIIVGGICGTYPQSHGRIAVLDEATLAPVHQIDASSAGPLPGEVKSAPLAMTSSGGATWVYFVCNAPQGALYGYRMGDAQATQLFVPQTSQQQYSIASVVPSQDGALLYSNDGGVLFKIAATAPSETHTPDTKDPSQTENDSHSGQEDASGTRRLPSSQDSGFSAGSRRRNAEAPESTPAEETAAESSDVQEGTSPDATEPQATAAEQFLGTADANSAPSLLWPVLGVVAGAMSLAFALLMLLLRRRSLRYPWLMWVIGAAGAVLLTISLGAFFASGLPAAPTTDQTLVQEKSSASDSESSAATQESPGSNSTSDEVTTTTDDASLAGESSSVSKTSGAKEPSGDEPVSRGPGHSDTSGAAPEPPASDTSAKADSLQVTLVIEGHHISKQVTVASGASVFDVLKASGVAYEAQSGAFGAYVTSIDGQAAAGSSGWTYQVNGTQPNVACSAYSVASGDTITWTYVTLQ